jgi:dTDP-D-glucose 4,6-dehydratase
LCLDEPGRNILVDHTINNIYIKVPENVVSVQSILSAVATKVSCEANELVILDVKFLEISDDKGEVYLYLQLF